MTVADPVIRLNTTMARLLDHLQAPFAAALRLFVAWQFFKSGVLKLQSWDSTLWLFENEYRTPLLPPSLAAVLGTMGELLFPLLVAAGLCSRLGALGLSAVNAMAVIAYAHYLFAEGSEAALAQHVLWGVMLLTIAVYGPGKLSVDYLLGRLRGSNAMPAAQATGLGPRTYI